MRAAAVPCCAGENKSGHDKHGDSRHLQDHQDGLGVAAAPHAEAVDGREDGQREQRDQPLRDGRAGELDGVTRKGRRDSGHAAALDDEQQRPAIEKGHGRMPGVAKVRVLTADLRPERGQLGIDEGAEQRHHPTSHPRAEDQQRCVDLPGHDIWVDEDPAPDDAAHHDHRRVEGTETTGQADGHGCIVRGGDRRVKGEVKAEGRGRSAVSR